MTFCLKSVFPICSSRVGCGFETAGDEVLFKNQNTGQEPKDDLSCLPLLLLAAAPSSIACRPEAVKTFRNDKKHQNAIKLKESAWWLSGVLI